MKKGLLPCARTFAHGELAARGSHGLIVFFDYFKVINYFWKDEDIDTFAKSAGCCMMMMMMMMMMMIPSGGVFLIDCLFV